MFYFSVGDGKSLFEEIIYVVMVLEKVAIFMRIERGDGNVRKVFRDEVIKGCNVWGF